MDKLLYLDENANVVSRVIVFANTSHVVNLLQATLDVYFDKLRTVSADDEKSAISRLEAINIFKEKKASILVATDIFSAGLDFADVSYVINFEMPTKFTQFARRCGRTGRLGNPGAVFSFFDFSTDFEIASSLADVSFVYI